MILYQSGEEAIPVLTVMIVNATTYDDCNDHEDDVSMMSVMIMRMMYL